MSSKIIAASIILSVLMISSVQLSHAQYQPLSEEVNASAYKIEFANSMVADSNEKKDVSSARAIAFSFTVLPPIAYAGLLSSISAPGMSANLLFGGIFLAGALIGPSTGSLYAGQSDLFWRGVLLRTGALGLTFLGMGPAGGFAIFDEPNPFGQIMMTLGAGFYIGHMIYDIFWGSRRAVEAHNEAVSDQVSVAPWIAPEGDGGGLQVQISF